MTPTSNHTPLSEEALNQTLTRLTTVAIPDGLEQRILANLASHQPTPLASPRRPAASWLQRPLLPSLQRLIVPPTPRPVLFTGLALASIALVTLGVRHVTTPKPPPAILASGRYTAPPQTAVASPPPSRATASPVARSPIRSPRPVAATQPAAMNTDAALALAETLAPSQLAPPLSVTEDERTLLQLAKRSAPDALNTLDATHRAAHEADEKAAFDTFFTPPAIPESRLKGESE